MKNIENPSIQDAARDLISISNELSNLRQAILQHSESAKGLDTASADISRLANILRKIPDSLLNLLQRGDQFIAKVDNSLAPAVVLSETIKNHNDNLNSQQELLAKITQFGEQNKILLSKIYNKSLSLPDSDALDSIGKRIDSLQKSFENHTESMDQVNKKIESFINFSTEKLEFLQKENYLNNDLLNQRHTTIENELNLMSGKIDTLHKNLIKINESIIQTFKKTETATRVLGQLSINQENKAKETSDKLLELERLAKRNLFEILIGRDINKNNS